MGKVEALAKRLTSCCPVAGAAQRCPEVDERPGSLESCGRWLEDGRRFAQELDASLSAFDQAGTAEGTADDARGAPPTRACDLALDEPTRLDLSSDRGE